MLSPAVSRGADRRDFDATELKESLGSLAAPIALGADVGLSVALNGRINAAHLIRQLLLSSPRVTRVQDAFRLHHGFESLLNAVSSPDPSCEQVASDPESCLVFAELFHACLTVLSAALTGHRGNCRYFKLRVQGEGWKGLEAAYLPWVGQDTPTGAAFSDKIFGSLLVCALNDDTNYSLFRDVRRTLEAHRKRPELSAEASEVDDTVSDPATDQNAVLNKVLDDSVQSSTFVHNSEPLDLIFRLWIHHSRLDSCENHRISQTDALVPQLLNKIADLRFHNLLALHGSEFFPHLLHHIFDSTVKEDECLSRLLQRLLHLGVPKQEHARQIYQSARHSTNVAELLLRSLESPDNCPFIHFDLSLHGYASVELPSMGRFPPVGKSAGYTIALWINVVAFDSDAHTTIFGALDASHTCFVLLYIERKTRNLILQTSSSSSSRPSVRFKSFSFRSASWYHVVLVHQRPRSIASSRASLYINGEFVEQVKSNYPLTPLSSTSKPRRDGTGHDEGAVTVQAFLGTPQDLATDLTPGGTKLQWRVASAHLLSDTLGDDLIAVLYRLGPRYVGNYQDCLGSFQTYEASAALNLRNENLHYGREEKSDIVIAIRQKGSLLLPEDLVVLNLSCVNMLTNEMDHKEDEQSLIVDRLSKPSGKIFRNIVRGGRHSILINGASPSMDAALRRSSGVAVLNGDPAAIVPRTLDDFSWRIGGCSSVVLSLFAAASDPQGLRRSLRILCSSIRNSWRNSEAMEKDNGFGVLANLLLEKVSLVEREFAGPATDVGKRRGYDDSFDNFCIDLLQILLDFVGYRVGHPEASIINNPLAYRILIVDLSLWRSLGQPVQKLYYQHFLDLGIHSKYRRFNVKRLTRMRK